MSTSRAGFTLIELIVALIILGVMLLGAVELLRLALEQARAAELVERIIWEVTDLTDSLETSMAVDVGQQDRPWGRLEWGARAVTAVDLRDSVLLTVPVHAAGPDSLIGGR